MTTSTSPALAAKYERHGVLMRGENNPRASLTAASVIEGRRRVRAGEKVAAVADELGVSRTGLAQAVVGNRWQWLDEVEPPVRGRRPPRHAYSDEDREALTFFAGTMIDAGARLVDAARCVGVVETTLSRWLGDR